nr:protein kinase-like domain, phloem protein 2-like protein [Tanacetum cinerariifolium]
MDEQTVHLPLKEQSDSFQTHIAALHQELQIARELLVAKPTTLGEVFSLARITEARLEDQCPTTTLAKSQATTTVAQTNKPSAFQGITTPLKSGIPTPTRPTTTPNTTPLAIKYISPAERQERLAKGLCFNSGNKWIHGHKCPGKFLLLMAGEDDDVVTELAPNEEDAVKSGDISILNSLIGHNNPCSLQLWGTIGNGDVLVIINNGSTHNFVRPDVVEKMCLPIKTKKTFKVYIRSGETLLCENVYSQVHLQMQGLEMEVDLYLFPMKGPDVVLGIQWLQKGTTPYMNRISLYRMQALLDTDEVYNIYEFYSLTMEAGVSEVTQVATGTGHPELDQLLVCNDLVSMGTMSSSLVYIPRISMSNDIVVAKAFYSGNVYKGATHGTHGDKIIAAKRLHKKSGQGDVEVLTELIAPKFMAELDILIEYKHKNVIGLVGYCDEEDEKIIVYEYASRGSLDKYLSDDSLTWVMRLKICIDIALGLEFLHGTVSSPEMVIHGDISSNNILLFDDWKAKITGFALSLVCPTNQNVDYVFDNITGTIGYRDPLHSKTGFLTKESDIFSLGAVLFDVLCGKLSSEKLDDEYLYLPFVAKYHYHVGKLDKLVFGGIKEQIVPQSYITFTRIALQCLHHMRERRPTANEVVIQLKKALEFQEDYYVWEPKLPKDYKEIIQKSKGPEIYSTIKKEDLYNIFSKGILLQQDKVLLSFVGDRERYEMVSATMFSYVGSCPHEWKSLPESSEPMYVNLKYRKGRESMHAYFATWRDEQWMMIELHRFLSQKEDAVFEFLLESFSSYYCGDAAVYVEGIEFRPIGK